MPMPSLPPRLLRRTVCPHCWSAFAAEEVLWVSAHADLLGDPLLGPDRHQRFLPTRFDLEGNALDANGFPCHELACPRCHLTVPRAVLETEPVFISVLGMPACGKSFFLTAMTWELRQVLPRHFALSFGDADPAANRNLNEYEELLFLNPRAEELTPLADLIRKTELQGELYDTVTYGGQTVSYPRPFLFALQALDDHPKFTPDRRLSRLLCLYDNAGEHFQPGFDSTASPVTHHLAHARLLMFLFDPTQDPRFRRLCWPGEPSLAAGRTSRQETLVHEAAVRVRRYTGLPHDGRHARPLVVVVTKSDVWGHLLENAELPDPWLRKDGVGGLDADRVELTSRAVRELLARVCPEVVTAAENFAAEVVYVPVSALGNSPVVHPGACQLAVRPADIRPLWVTVPLLYGVCRWVPGVIPALRHKHVGSSTVRIQQNELPDFLAGLDGPAAPAPA
jgi:hypothetical protein